MLTLIKNARVFSPADQGLNDVLMANGSIAAIAPELTLTGSGVDVETIDAEARWLVPGFVDPLAHFNGGGGEGGFHTRTPVMPITDAIKAGIATMVSGLGTDASTRTLEDMLANAHGLSNLGLTTYCYTGSYQYPVVTVTGSIRNDLILIDKMIGIGELAIADKRGSQLTAAELARVASEAKVGGLLSGKAGVTFLHVGDEQSQLSLIEQVTQDFDVDVNQFYPTHINRHTGLMQQGAHLAKQGMMLDLTCSTTPELVAEGEIPAAKCVAQLLDLGVAVSQISISTDANASLPDFDAHGQLRGLKVGRAVSLLETVQECLRDGIPPATVFAVAASNAAKRLKLDHKGTIEIGADADLNLLCPDSFTLTDVWYRGRRMMNNGEILQRGYFQP